MTDEPQNTQNLTPQPLEPLQYEETPVIEPISEPENSPPLEPPTPIPTAPPKKSGPGFLSTFIFLIILFVAGIGLSFFLKQFLPNGISLSKSKTAALTKTPQPTITSTIPRDIYATWKTYSVISGLTRQSIPGISFKLPQEIAAPICDGGNCASQGTYLPGGTRFTVAPRGVGQLLPNYNGQILTDLSGQAFTVKTASVSGLAAADFSGLFTGTTNGGYAFSQMHGLMIQVSPSLSLEVNHFTPNGVTADFSSDDSLFSQILNSFAFNTPEGSQGAAIPSPALTLTPTATSTFTPSTTAYPTPTTH